MRHRVAGRKFNRPTAHRLAMYRNMVTSLLRHEHLVTTVARAKEIRSFAEHVITLGKRGDLPARREALGFLYDKGLVDKVFHDFASRYKDRQGGYTRIVRMGLRKGDAAEVAQIELLPAPAAPEEAKKAG